MPQFEHVKDLFGNDIYFGDGGEVRFPAQSYIPDYRQHLRNIRDMQLREDDILIAAYLKSGNNWFHHMASMLVEGATTLPSVHGDNEYIWIDGCGGYKHLPPPDRPRVLFSHLLLRHLPRDVLEKKVKVVYLTRNPKDVFASLYCHLQNFDKPYGYSGTWSEFFDTMLKQGWFYGDVFEHMRDWEREIDGHPELPVLHLTFEDAVQDTLTQVEKLNSFLGTNRDRDLCRSIAETCQFSNMKNTRLISQEALKSAHWKDGVPAERWYRKGIVGDWKNWFTVAQNDKFDAVCRRKMEGSKRTFRYE